MNTSTIPNRARADSYEIWPENWTCELILSLADQYALLISWSDDQVTQKVSLADGPIVLGRGSACDLIISDRWASREHCELSLEHGEFVARDLDSKHGTFIGEHRVSRSELLDGDNLFIGTTRFVVSHFD